MALLTNVVTFTLNTTPGAQVVGGVGFLGTSLFLLTTRQLSAGVTDGTAVGIGITDGVNQSCRSVTHPDNEAATTSAQVQHVAERIIRLANTAGAVGSGVEIDVAFTGFTSSGFSLNILQTTGEAIVCAALVLGGSAVEADGLNTPPITASTIVVTGLTYQTDAFVILGGTEGGSYVQKTPFGSMHGFGFSDGVLNHCTWALGRGTGGAADCRRGQRTDKLYTIRTANLGGAGDLASGRITAVSPTGYTITRDSSSVVAQPFILSIKGVRIAMGTFTQPPTAGTQILTLPFHPRAVFLQTHGTVGDNVDNYGLSIGVWASGGQASVWGGGLNGANPSVYARAMSTTRVLQIYTPVATGSASTLVGEVEVTSASPTSLDLNWSVSDGTARQILYCAIGTGVESTCSDGVVPSVIDPPGGVEFEGLWPHRDRIFIELDLD